jgi:hypothetical protein
VENMTNEKRIFELCSYVIDLIDVILLHDDILDDHFTWVKNEVSELREKIYTEEKNKGVNIYD